MKEKYSTKALQEMDGLGFVTTVGLKALAKILGFMTEDGKITETGMEHFEYRHKKTTGSEYLATSKEFAERYVKHWRDN